jgi:hypothetical protein
LNDRGAEEEEDEEEEEEEGGGGGEEKKTLCSPDKIHLCPVHFHSTSV